MIITVIQIICCGILFVQYFPQIKLIFINKGCRDVSIMMYVTRLSSTTISCYTLSLSHNSFIVIVSQYVSLILSAIVIIEMCYYIFRNHKLIVSHGLKKDNKKDKGDN